MGIQDVLLVSTKQTAPQDCGRSPTATNRNNRLWGIQITCSDEGVSTKDDDVSITASQSTIHDSWTKDETLFPINALRDFLEEEENLQSSLADLSSRIRRGTGHQKSIFRDIAKKPSEVFFNTKTVTNTRVKATTPRTSVPACSSTTPSRDKMF